MRTIVHISDLHFGCADPALVTPLIEAVTALAPDVIAVSGDLTQRARTAQFRAARDFLDRLPFPRIVVPGNHDIPLHNLYARFVDPLRRYRRTITDDLEPYYVDDEVAVMGVNTARSLTVKAGRMNVAQVAAAQTRFCALPDAVARVLVTHHPFDLPAGTRERELVGRAAMAMAGLAACGVHILLSGHLHTGRLGSTHERFALGGHAALVVQAGTTLSTRRRGEVNSFNRLELGPRTVAVERYGWDEARAVFVPGPVERFRLEHRSWQRA